MTEYLDSINEVPERIVVSGEGLRGMGLEQYKALVMTLGGLGLRVEGIDYPDSEATGSFEESKDDPILYKSDFTRVAGDSGIHRSIATRAWNCLTNEWRYHADAKRRKEDGLELTETDRKWLSKLPAWRKDLCISEGEVSFAKLRIAFEAELLGSIRGMGSANLDLIQKVITDTEEKLLKDTSSDNTHVGENSDPLGPR